ncbi:MAG: glycosyltransferase family 2 protein [Phycisphaerales bacterium]|nr:glycosyltransferase family 2 protein [Phycisphaerales bacterium]
MRWLVAIPAYNEEQHLPAVLDAVREYTRHIVVIDDGSTDATSAILDARPEIQRVTHGINLGYGRSVIDAFDYAAAHHFDWVITMDCDEQHEPAQIPHFVAEMTRDRADVISGSRYLIPHPQDDAAPLDRRRINHTITRVLMQRLGLRLTDSFCGFKAHRVCAMQRLRLSETGYAFPLQFWARCVQEGLRITEIPVRRIYRDASRVFGGMLDDPEHRLRHYLEVLERTIQQSPVPCGARRAASAACH